MTSNSTDKRLALVCQHFYPEMISTGMLLTELATRLVEMGWQITVYCAKPSWGVKKGNRQKVPSEIFYEGIRILRVATIGEQQGSLLSRLLFAVSFTLSVGWALWRKRAEYPILVMTTNPPFLGIVSWLHSRLFKRPYLFIVHDVYPDIVVELGVLQAGSWLAKIWERITRLILCEAAVVVVIGRDMARVIKRKMRESLHGRIVLIPNWSDDRHVKPIPREQNSFYQEHRLNGEFVVQYAGRMGRTHNLEPLLEAARLMNGCNVRFQFVGEGAKRSKLEALAVEYALDNVEFLPYQPLDRLPEMLSAADLAVVCLESFFTGLSVPSKTYGVIASGTPVLGFLDTDSEIGQMVAETGCGLVLRDPNDQEIARAIKELIADPQMRTAMAQAGRKAFLEEYSLTKAALDYDRALMSILSAESDKRWEGT